MENKEEVGHIITVLRDTQRALQNSDAFALQQLSDQTIHSASIHQHTDFIIIAVLLYSLNKMVMRKEKAKESKWKLFVKKFNDELEKSIKSLKDRDTDEFTRHVEHAKDVLIKISPIIREDIEEVIRRASINKAGRIYEHGISLSQTAKLLDITPWELGEYIGQGGTSENPNMQTIDIKKRARIALEFFS